MARLTQAQVTEFAKKALSHVADFSASGDIKKYAFDAFNAFHKEVFASHLKNLILAEPYHADAGGTLDTRYHDISLNPEIVNSWATIGDCIEYVVREQSSFPVSTRSKLNLQ